VWSAVTPSQAFGVLWLCVGRFIYGVGIGCAPPVVASVKHAQANPCIWPQPTVYLSTAVPTPPVAHQRLPT
jgi:MFS family permease